MSITFTCPACKRTLKTGNDQLAGKTIKCPKCGAPCPIPHADNNEVVQEAKPIKQPARRQGKGAPPEGQRRHRPGDDDDGRHGQRRKRQSEPRKKAFPIALILGVGGGTVAVLAVVVVVVFVIFLSGNRSTKLNGPAGGAGPIAGRPLEPDSGKLPLPGGNEPEFILAVEDFLQELQKDPAGFEKKYKDKLIQLSGTVGEVNIALHHYTVSLGYALGKRVSFAMAEEKPTQPIAKGERMTLRGTLTQVVANTPILANGMIVQNAGHKEPTQPKSDPAKFGPITVLDRKRVYEPIAATFFEGTPLLLSLGDKHDTLSLWNVIKGDKVRTMIGDINPIYPNIVFSSSGRFAASGLPGQQESTVNIWDLKTGLHMTWKSPGGHVRSLDFSPDEKHLIVVASKVLSEKVTFWSLEKQQPTKDLSEHLQSTERLKISPDGQRLAVSTFDDATNKRSLIKIWDLPAQKFVAELKGHTSDIFQLEFSPDGKLLTSGSRNGTIKLWQLPAGSELHSWQQKGRIRALAFSPDSKTLAIASEADDGQPDAHLYDINTKKRMHSLDGHTHRIHWFSWHPNGHQLLSSGLGEAILWNVPRGT